MQQIPAVPVPALPAFARGQWMDRAQGLRSCLRRLRSRVPLEPSVPCAALLGSSFLRRAVHVRSMPRSVSRWGHCLLRRSPERVPLESGLSELMKWWRLKIPRARRQRLRSIPAKVPAWRAPARADSLLQPSPRLAMCPALRRRRPRQDFSRARFRQSRCSAKMRAARQPRPAWTAA